MADWWSQLVERFLPWYEPARERQRDAKSERTVRRSAIARLRGERVIAEYRAAAKSAGKAGEALIDEVRRADDT